MAVRRNRTLLFSIAIATLLLCASSARAAEPTVVVFFSGLCNSPEACVASQKAADAISPKLPPGTRLIAPALDGGAFPNQGSLNSTLSSLGSNRIVFVAFSAGYKALGQSVQSMDAEAIKRVKTIVSLEANYPSFEAAVNKVKSINPQVEVYRYTAAQFGTYHAGMPGSAGVADAISKIAGGDGTVVAGNAGNVTIGSPPINTSWNPVAPSLSPSFAPAQAPYAPLLSSGLPAYSQSLSSAFSVPQQVQQYPAQQYATNQTPTSIPQQSSALQYPSSLLLSPSAQPTVQPISLSHVLTERPLVIAYTPTRIYPATTSTTTVVQQPTNTFATSSFVIATNTVQSGTEPPAQPAPAQQSSGFEQQISDLLTKIADLLRRLLPGI